MNATKKVTSMLVKLDFVCPHKDKFFVECISSVLLPFEDNNPIPYFFIPFHMCFRLQELILHITNGSKESFHCVIHLSVFYFARNWAKLHLDVRRILFVEFQLLVNSVLIHFFILNFFNPHWKCFVADLPFLCN